MKRIIILLPIIVIFCWILAIGVIPEAAQAQPPNGRVPGPPLDYLQQQIDELKAQLDEIQSVPGGGVLVRDNNGQLLGTLVDTQIAGPSVWPPAELVLFVEDLSVLISIDEETGNVNNRPLIEMYYQDDSCSGEPYIMSGSAIRYNTIYHSTEDVHTPIPLIDMYYYAVSPNTGPMYGLPVGSYFTSYPTPHCEQPTGPYYLYDVTRIIEVPGDQIPFTLPAALPLHYVSQ